MSKGNNKQENQVGRHIRISQVEFKNYTIKLEVGAISILKQSQKSSTYPNQ